MMATHEVLRERTIQGKVRHKGDLIDASGLRTADLMVRQRHLRPLTFEEQQKLTKKEK
jgi:hypothetical protein